jgi:magnesium chelatase subunit I
MRQEAIVGWPGSSHAAPVVPDHLLEIVARFTRLVRDSPQVDQRSGVSARFAVAATETVAASAVRRAAVTGERQAVARVCDLPAVIPASRGKVEFEAAEEGRELEVLAHLLRKATADAFRARLAGVDLTGLQARFDEGATVETGDLVPAADLLERLGTVPGLSAILAKLGIEEESPGLAAAAVEFALEGLHLNRRLSKDAMPGRTVYGG